MCLAVPLLRLFRQRSLVVKDSRSLQLLPRHLQGLPVLVAQLAQAAHAFWRTALLPLQALVLRLETCSSPPKLAGPWSCPLLLNVTLLPRATRVTFLRLLVRPPVLLPPHLPLLQLAHLTLSALSTPTAAGDGVDVDVEGDGSSDGSSSLSLLLLTSAAWVSPRRRRTFPSSLLRWHELFRRVRLLLALWPFLLLILSSSTGCLHLPLLSQWPRPLQQKLPAKLCLLLWSSSDWKLAKPP
jgi:hypothetical protein